MNQALTMELVRPPETRIVPDIVDVSNLPTRIAQQRIKSSKYAEVRSIHCEAHAGILLLRGKVSSYYLKQVAQEVVRSVKGIEAIANRVEVSHPRTTLKVKPVQVTKE